MVVRFLDPSHEPALNTFAFLFVFDAQRAMSPISEEEAKYYYTGLPSCPLLIARTSTTPWDRQPKELGPASHHALHKAWEDGLARKAIDLLKSRDVEWTSIDIVRIGPAEEYYRPVILWIGVTPGSLSHDDGLVVASKCKALLEEHDITDVDVEIRESVVRFL